MYSTISEITARGDELKGIALKSEERLSIIRAIEAYDKSKAEMEEVYNQDYYDQDTLDYSKRVCELNVIELERVLADLDRDCELRMQLRLRVTKLFEASKVKIAKCKESKDLEGMKVALVEHKVARDLMRVALSVTFKADDEMVKRVDMLQESLAEEVA